MIRTPDQRLRVFISSTLQELGPERNAVRDAVTKLRLTPVMFELGARPHAPRNLYRAYLEQSHIFIGVYWQSYGWVAPGMDISGLEDEYLSAGARPRLIYIKEPAPHREPELKGFLDRVKTSDVSYKRFSTPKELARFVQDDVAILLTERFQSATSEIPTSDESRRPGLFGIPEDITSIVGRAREVDEIAALLKDDHVRLVTLSGPGGIGKTRLATEVARAVSDDFPDGVRFVPLAPVKDETMVAAAIGHQLGIREEERRPWMDLIKQELAPLKTLLVLDNFEHILGAAPIVAELLAAVPGMKMLITSRALLRIRGEHDYPVPPLELPTDGAEARSLDQYAAVRLFIERARLVKPDFAVDNDNAPAIAAICHRLDGLPLAIELAAARIKILSPEALMSRLSSSLKILTGGYRDLPERQQTLRGAIDWSYELLDEADRILFTRLAVFLGGRSLEAIEEVCNPDGVLDVLSGIESLVDKSLLRQVGDVASDPRFRMLETLHEYALDRLQERGEVDRFRELHANYFQRLAQRAREELRGADQADWFDRLEDEHENVRLALRWAAEHNEVDTLLWMIYGLCRFWMTRGYVREGSVWTETAVMHVDQASIESASHGLFAAGHLAHARGDHEAAEAHWHHALEICSKAEDPEGVATIQNVLGDLEFERGHLEAATHLYEHALALFTQIDDTRGRAQCLNNLGHIASAEKDWNRSIALLEESLRLFDRLRDQRWVARAVLNIGVTHREAGNLQEARRYVQEATRLWDELGARYDLTACLADWAATEMLLGNNVEATEMFGAAEALREEIATPMWSSEAEILHPYWEQLRDRLGAEEFAQAWDVGKGLGVDDAVRRILAAPVVARQRAE